MKRLLMLFALAVLAAGLIGIIGCAGETVVETVVVEKIVPGDTVVETVVIEKEVPVEKTVVQTVVVEKAVEVEKTIVETVVVQKEVEVEKKVVETVVVEKQVQVVVTPTPRVAGDVKIGTLLDYTGDLGVYGPAMRNGVDLAVELVNDGGVFSTASSAQSTKTAARAALLRRTPPGPWSQSTRLEPSSDPFLAE